LSDTEDTIIDALHEDRAIHVVDATLVTVSNLSVRNGFAHVDREAGHGGGILLEAGELVLDQVSIEDCEAAGNGGALATFGDLLVQDSVLSNNRAENGGAIGLNPGVEGTITNTVIGANTAIAYGGGIYGSDAGLELTGATLQYNTAGGNGGGVFLSGASLSVRDTTIRDNDAVGDGGGFYIQDVVTHETIAFVTSTIVGNATGYEGYGGGVHVDAPASLRFTEVVVSGNQAEGGAGGGVSMIAGSITTKDSLFEDNSAQAGGGLWLGPDTDGHTEASWSCENTGSGAVWGGFRGNQADIRGAAVYVAGMDTLAIEVDHCDFGSSATANLAVVECDDVYIADLGVSEVCDLSAQQTFECDVDECDIAPGTVIGGGGGGPTSI
jgi:hypothetical protein